MKFSTALLLPLIAIPLTSAFPLFPSLFRRATNLNSTTQNDIVSNLPCKPLTIIFARGTVSPGNVGESTGPPFFKAVAAAIGVDNLALQGVDYSASIFGFLGGGDSKGSATMLTLINRTFTQCPSTKVVISGYSQGAQLVHNAAKQLTAANAAKVSSVVLFGDPFFPMKVGAIDPAKVIVFCHEGDNICEGGIFVFDTHHTYGTLDSPAAAAFVKARAGL